jgi:hypothetical protein
MEGEKETVTFEELQPGMKIQNAACRWEILGFPRYTFMHPQHGARMTVRARAEFITASYSPREVELQGYACDELEVTL